MAGGFFDFGAGDRPDFFSSQEEWEIAGFDPTLAQLNGGFTVTQLLDGYGLDDLTLAELDELGISANDDPNTSGSFPWKWTGTVSTSGVDPDDYARAAWDVWRETLEQHLEAQYGPEDVRRSDAGDSPSGAGAYGGVSYG